jgi:hypothetical protein
MQMSHFSGTRLLEPFLKAKVLRRLGKDGLALTYHYKATTLRGQILKSSTVEDTDLVEDDFDRLVTFWSR